MAAMSPDGNRGDSLEVTTFDDLAGGSNDWVTAEGGLAFDRDPISLGDVLDVDPGASVPLAPSPDRWWGLMRGAGGAPAFADVVLGAGDSSDAGNLTIAGRIAPGDVAQQAAAVDWLQSESFERLAAHLGASPQPEAPAVVVPHRPTPGDPRFAVQHPGTAQHSKAPSDSLPQSTDSQVTDSSGGVPGDKKIL